MALSCCMSCCTGSVANWMLMCAKCLSAVSCSHNLSQVQDGSKFVVNQAWGTICCFRCRIWKKWVCISGPCIYFINNRLSLSSQFRQSPRRTSPHFRELCPQAGRVIVRGKGSHLQASVVSSLGVFWLFNVLIQFSSEWSCVIAAWSLLWFWFSK